ncbi:hypothetical protein ACLD1C_15445, partial [Acinetobacter baumannii]
ILTIKPNFTTTHKPNRLINFKTDIFITKLSKNIETNYILKHYKPFQYLHSKKKKHLNGNNK